MSDLKARLDEMVKARVTHNLTTHGFGECDMEYQSKALTSAHLYALEGISTDLLYKLDEREAQVEKAEALAAMLREAIEYIGCRTDHCSADPCSICAKVDEALEATATAAQAFEARVRREEREAALERYRAKAIPHLHFTWVESAILGGEGEG